MNTIKTPVHQISLGETQQLLDSSRCLLKQFLPLIMKYAFETFEGTHNIPYEEVVNYFPEIRECAKLLGEIPMWDPSAEPNEFGLHLTWVPFSD